MNGADAHINKNACILHYTDNNQVLKKGDVILMDFGAEYRSSKLLEMLERPP